MKNSLLILSVIIFALALAYYLAGQGTSPVTSTYWGNAPEKSNYWLAANNSNLIYLQKAERFSGSITEVKDPTEEGYFAILTLANFNQDEVDISVVNIPSKWSQEVLRRVEAGNSLSPIITPLTVGEVQETIKRKGSEDVFIRLSTSNIYSAGYQLLESFLIYTDEQAT